MTPDRPHPDDPLDFVMTELPSCLEATTAPAPASFAEVDRRLAEVRYAQR